MSGIPVGKLAQLVAAAREARTTNEKGQALEDLICALFSWVPGIEIAERNRLNAFRTEEVDVAIWNNQSSDGFPFLPYVVIIECKNWSQAVGTEEVVYFVEKCESRGCDHGVLIAMNGISGDPALLTAAHSVIAAALRRGTKIIVLTIEEIENLRSIEDLIRMIKRKLCQLAVAGTIAT